MVHELKSTGFVQRVDNPTDRIPDFDSRSGDHFWVMLLSYHISNPEKFMKGDGLLDLENLVSTVGPGCFYCEEVYTPFRAKRRCLGHP